MAPSRPPLVHDRNALNVHRPTKPKSRQKLHERAKETARISVRTEREPTLKSTASPPAMIAPSRRRSRVGPASPAKARVGMPLSLLTEAEFRQAEYQVAMRQTNPAFLDHMAFGREVASFLPPVEMQVPLRVIFGDDALREYCRRNGLKQHRPLCDRSSELEVEVIRYEHPLSFQKRTKLVKGKQTSKQSARRSPTDLQLPVVWMNNNNAPGVDSIRIGQHGFAWMFAPECSDLDKLGAFHLFNNPGPRDDWKVRNYHYCGKYYAQRTGRHMTTDGWNRLPPAARDTAVMFHTLTRDVFGETRTREASCSLLEEGALPIELVILQFCGLPDRTVPDKLHEAAGSCLKPAKPPGTTPNPLALVRLFAKHGQELVDEHLHMQAIRQTPRFPVQ